MGLACLWRARSAVAIWVRILAIASSISIRRLGTSGKPGVFAVKGTASVGEVMDQVLRM
jgi:hypothetical protein